MDERWVPSLACVLSHWTNADAGPASDKFSRSTLAESWVGVWAQKGHWRIFEQIRERIYGPEPLLPPLRLFSSALLVDGLGREALSKADYAQLTRLVLLPPTPTAEISMRWSEHVCSTAYFARSIDDAVPGYLAEAAMLQGGAAARLASTLLRVIAATEEGMPCPVCRRAPVHASVVFSHAKVQDLKEALFR